MRCTMHLVYHFFSSGLRFCQMKYVCIQLKITCSDHSRAKKTLIIKKMDQTVQFLIMNP